VSVAAVHSASLRLSPHRHADRLAHTRAVEPSPNIRLALAAVGGERRCLGTVSTLMPASELHLFSVRREDAGRVPVLVVAGGIDADTAPQLSAAVCAFGCEKVVVDLREVDHIDSDGLRDLLLAARLLAVGLHVVCPTQGPARRLVDAAESTRSLSIHESRSDALAELANRW